MDNAAHTLCGLALARLGLDRYGKSATVTTVVAANLPDLDIVVHPVLGKTGYLCYHRGITHALLGLGVESLLLATVVWWIARRWHPDTRWSPLWLCAALGLATHLGLDSLNTYGVRPFLPFSGTWYYGDAAFIMEPWIWLGFGFGACAGSPSKLTRATLNGWLLWSSVVFTLLTFGGKTPLWMSPVWVLGMGGALYLRRLRLNPSIRRWLTAAGVAVAVLYPLAVVLPFNRSAGERAREAIEELGDPVVSLTVHPSPAAPWRYRAVVSTAELTYRVEVNLLERAIEVGDPLERNLDHPMLELLTADNEPAEYAAWREFAREPFVARVGSSTLILGDARYADAPVPSWCNLEVEVPGQ